MMWRVHSLGDTTDSLLGEISSLHLFFKGKMLEAGVNGSRNIWWAPSYFCRSKYLSFQHCHMASSSFTMLKWTFLLTHCFNGSPLGPSIYLFLSRKVWCAQYMCSWSKFEEWLSWYLLLIVTDGNYSLAFPHPVMSTVVRPNDIQSYE